jgi:hypothetical protein
VVLRGGVPQSGLDGLDVGTRRDQHRREGVVIRHISTSNPPGATVSTAMRVVNAMPYVVDAETGPLSALDLSLTLPRHVPC